MDFILQLSQRCTVRHTSNTFIFRASIYKNVTFSTLTQFSLSQLYSILTSEVVRQTVIGLMWVANQEGRGRCLRRMTRRAVKKFVYRSTLCKPNHLVTWCSKPVQPASRTLFWRKSYFLLPRRMATRKIRNVT